MPNKNVEGVWVVTGILLVTDSDDNEFEYKCKSRVATTEQGLKAAIKAARKYSGGVIRVEVEAYTVCNAETYNAN